MRKTTLPGLFFILLFLLSGCGAALSGAMAASSTPTIVRLPAVTETPDTPVPTPPLSPSPAPTSTPVTPGPGPASPTVTARAVTSTSVSIPLAGATGPGTAAASTSLTGAWDFTFGTMSLTQRDSRVEGTYQWYGGLDSGQIQGVALADLNQFQGLWLSNRSSNSQGELRWQLAVDWTSFSGSFESSKTGQWCGVRSGQPLPAGCGFSGVWQLRFGDPPDVTGQATLVQTGQTVQGTYIDSQGHTGEIVDGVITVESLTEAKLSGTWRNDQGEQDAFEWWLDLTTGRTFQGRRDPGNSEWCGWREGTGQPEQCGW